jgi:hypothetical protein
MSIQGVDGRYQLPQEPIQARGAQPVLRGLAGQDAARSQSLQITNESGQTLFDIRDQLSAAVKQAIQDFDGEGDLASAVQGAIQSTLEENGFDPDALREAAGGASPIAAIRALRQGAGAPGGVPGAGALGAVTGGFGADLSSLLQQTRDSDQLLESFFAQFRPGSQLDFEV